MITRERFVSFCEIFYTKINYQIFKTNDGMYLLAEGHGSEKLSTFKLKTPEVK